MCAAKYSAASLEPEPQQIYSITDKRRYSGAFGHARPVVIEDAVLLADWLTAFHRKVVPHDPVPARDDFERATGQDRFLFWIDDDQPISVEGVARRLQN
jgi:hypothetical protein